MYILSLFQPLSRLIHFLAQSAGNKTLILNKTKKKPQTVLPLPHCPGFLFFLIILLLLHKAPYIYILTAFKAVCHILTGQLSIISING